MRQANGNFDIPGGTRSGGMSPLTLALMALLAPRDSLAIGAPCRPECGQTP
jgi:hypothetical protein